MGNTYLVIWSQNTQLVRTILSQILTSEYGALPVMLEIGPTIYWLVAKYLLHPEFELLAEGCEKYHETIKKWNIGKAKQLFKWLWKIAADIMNNLIWLLIFPESATKLKRKFMVTCGWLAFILKTPEKRYPIHDLIFITTEKDCKSGFNYYYVYLIDPLVKRYLTSWYYIQDS